MIMMGAGTNHWYHGDQIYRAMLSLVLLCGCQAATADGWAHYVGQEKVRPITGLRDGVCDRLDPSSTVAGDAVLVPRPRASNATSASRRRAGLAARRRTAKRPSHIADFVALGARVGWLPSYPTFEPQLARTVDEAERQASPAGHVVSSSSGRTSWLRRRGSGRAGQLPAHDDPLAGEPVRLLGQGRTSTSSGTCSASRSTACARRSPASCVRRRSAGASTPKGKLDLLTTIDFRMTSNALFSDIVLPAATWYEKFDISTTDLHPFVHAFNQAVPPPWEAKSDWDAFDGSRGPSRTGRAPPRRPRRISSRPH